MQSRNAKRKTRIRPRYRLDRAGNGTRLLELYTHLQRNVPSDRMRIGDNLRRSSEQQQKSVEAYAPFFHSHAVLVLSGSPKPEVLLLPPLVIVVVGSFEIHYRRWHIVVARLSTWWKRTAARVLTLPPLVCLLHAHCSSTTQAVTEGGAPERIRPFALWLASYGAKEITTLPFGTATYIKLSLLGLARQPQPRLLQALDTKEGVQFCQREVR